MRLVSGLCGPSNPMHSPLLPQIMNEGATYRGVIKNYAREIVVMAYGLHLNVADADAAPSPEVQAQYVRERVAALTKDSVWLMVRILVIPFPSLTSLLKLTRSDRTGAVPSGTRLSSSSSTRPSFGDTRRPLARRRTSTRSRWRHLPSAARL